MSNGQQLIPPWKKAACNRVVAAWNDTATDYWEDLTPEGQAEVIALEERFAEEMNTLFQRHFTGKASDFMRSRVRRILERILEAMD